MCSKNIPQCQFRERRWHSWGKNGVIHGMADSMECFPWGRIVLREPVGLVQFMSPIKTSVFHETTSVSHWLWAELEADLDLIPLRLCFLSSSLANVPSLCHQHLLVSVKDNSPLLCSFFLLSSPPFLPSLLPFFLLFLACFLVKVVTKVYLETSCLLFVLDRNVSSTLQTKRLRTGLIW